MVGFIKKTMIFGALLFVGSVINAVTLNIKDPVDKAVAAKKSGDTKELAKQCGVLASEGRLLRYRLDENQKQQVFDACGDIFKYGAPQKGTKAKKGDETTFKDPKAYAATAFSLPRILKAVTNEGECRAIGQDLFSLDDADFKAGVSAGRTNFMRDVCGSYFAENAGKGGFGEVNRNAYHKLDPTFWRTISLDPVRASLLKAAKESEGSVTRGAACALLAGDLPTKFLNDENKRLSCMICGSGWKGKDNKAYENTCGALQYTGKASPDDEEVDEPVKPTKKSNLSSSSADLASAASDYASSASALRAKLKQKYAS